MPTRDDVIWFKTQFQPQIEAAIAGTPLTVDFIAAIACQETGSIWPGLRRQGLPVELVLALCVGDTLDADRGRRAFPTTKADLVARDRGDEMFALAHQSLIGMAAHVPGYAGVAKRPDKFCHGFGIFQRDLQFFLTDPDYFLDGDWAHFDKALAQCLGELERAIVKLGFSGRETLTDAELAAVGIAYNTGGFRASKGLKQGHFDGTRFYGEAIFEFLRLAHTAAVPGTAPAIEVPPAGQATIALPTPVTAEGPAMRVATRQGMLRLRREPRISTPPQANVVAHLPDGQPVRALTGKLVNGFIELETSLAGALLRGFASKDFLVADAVAAPIEVVTPAVVPPKRGIVAVTMPRRAGSVTRRRDLANAHSLNEAGQPGRRGTSAAELREDIARIITWLAVDNVNHLRYRPRSGLTFCNIYAHDFCSLAGVYLPRVWWSSRALLRMAAGETVEPRIGDTIGEVRANDLFRWLRDFGPDFGWRQTGTLSKLQDEANQGAIGLIVARRKEDGRSGHIVAVVPEDDVQRARRNAAGEVTAPVQSQAGTTNFQRGVGRTGWWNGEQFAESAFWLHA
ncbi:MAG: hypothetical protein M9915_05305 [Rhizobacter sp.]|nr:hypothetical protein [Rhizobacter sp.]